MQSLMELQLKLGYCQMEIAILLGLLGFGFAAGMGGGSGDDTTSDVEPEETESDGTTEPDAPQTFEIGDSVLTYDVTGSFVTGTEGDDTVIGDEGNDLGGPDIFLGAGDDYADPLIIENEIHGGDGNDTLVAYDRSELFGDDGDDLLIGEGGGTSQGGNGNDTISDGGIASGGAGDDVISGTAYPYAAAEGFGTGMSGDEGDDTLTAHSYSFNYDTSNYDSLLDVSGGEGADVFDVQIDMPRVGSPAYSLEDIERDTFLNLSDFEPDEDVLTVQINGTEENPNFEMTWAEIGLRDFADESSSEPMLERVVQMNFAATETTGTFTTWFRVGSELDFPIDEIDFVAGPGVTIRDDVLVLPTDGTSVVFDPDDNFADPLVVYSDHVEYWEIGSFGLSDGDDYADIRFYNAGVYGELGDDTLTIHSSQSFISGGEGDDLITALSGESGLSGGEGNDTLNGFDNNHISGGAGDDVINVSIEGDQRVYGSTDGGEGDDTISLTAEIGDDGSYGSIVSPISGGEGADAFDVQLNLSDTSYNVDDLDTSNSGTILELSDFDPNEDSLVIQINRGDGNEDRDMTSAEIISNNIVITFAATDTFGEHTTAIKLGHDVNITLDDIVFVQN